jgi:hypothetical protein
MSYEVLPLAITMMAGPQIMSAIIFVTAERPIAASVAFIGGVAVAATAGTAIALGVASVAGDSLGDPGDTSSGGHVVQYVLVALLIASAIRNYADSQRDPELRGPGDRRAAQVARDAADRRLEARAAHRPASDPGDAIGTSS